MALKDCIKKLGVVSKQDVAKLEGYLEAGLTDQQAVRRLLIETSVDVIDIADRARQGGAQVRVPGDKLGELRDLQDKRLRKLMSQREAVEDKIAENNAEYRDMAQNANMIDQAIQRKIPRFDSLEGLEESEAIMVLSQIMFDSNLRSGLERGVLGVQGSTPRAVYDSWQKQRELRVANRKHHGELIAQHNKLNSQVHQLLAGLTYNQETVLDERGNYAVMEGGKQVDEGKQGDLFAEPAMSPEQRKESAETNYRIRVKHETMSEFSIGVETVESAGDAAHVLAPIRRNAQENMVALVLDKDNKPIAVVHHAKGTIDGTGVYPSVLAGAIYNTPGAHSVWFGHNHPSGHNEPSQADERITKTLHRLMAGAGIKIRGHLVIAAGGKAAQMDQEGRPMGAVSITPARRNLKVPVTERVLRAKPGPEDTVNSPAAMKELLKKSKGKQGVYLFDNRHRPLGYVPMTEEQMESLRGEGGAAELFKAIDRTNAAAIVLVTTGPAPAAVDNIANFADNSGIRMLDAFWGPDFKSRASDHSLPLGGRKTYMQSKKGSITFDEARKATINLYQAADFSTFIHEAGHLYLEIMGTMAESLGATEQVMRDWQTILSYLGVKERGEITREHHELWARSFEKYAMDGKAPSITLQDAFNAFRRWLGEIYKRIAGVRDIELPDDIRGVMDRMLATDVEIQQAESQQEFAALFTSAEQMGVSQEVFDVYKNALTRAHDDAVQNETVKLLKAMKRDEQEWYKEEAKKVGAEVAAEVHQMKVYNALAILMRGENADGTKARAPFKLDRESLLDLYQGSTKMLKLLPHTGAYGIYRRKGGLDVDVAAQRLGYTDGRALIEALLKAPPMEDVIEAETMRRMDQIYPDPFKDGTLAENAVKQVHNQRRAEVLAAEMRQLRALQRRDKPIVKATEQAAKREDKQAREANRGILPKRAELAMIKEGARQAIGAKQLRSVNPYSYLQAERKAGRLAFEAAAKSDYQKAFLHKRQQLINHEMYRAAVQAKERSAKTQKYLSKFESKRVQQRLGRSDVLNEILAVLEGIDFRRRSLKAIDRQKIEKELAVAVEASELAMPPGVLDRIFDDRVSWQELTVDELDATRDLIKQLEHRAKAEVEAIVNGEKVMIRQRAAEVADEVYDNNKLVPALTSEPTGWEDKKKSLKQGVSTWLRPSSIARILDKSGFGAITRNIIVPIRRAYAERLIPDTHKMQKELAQLYRDHFDDEQLSNLHKRRFRIEAQNESYSHADLLSMALNWGNEYNRKAVLEGRKRDGTPAYTQAGVRQMLAQLTESDWAFVQASWDYLETYWPDIRDAERRRRGVAPKQVEPMAFTIRAANGAEVTMRGGYYPLKYSREHSERTKIQEYEDHYKNAINGRALFVSTRAGSTYERTNSGGQVVRLGLKVMDAHLREVIRDITIGDEINYLKRVLNDKELRNAFVRTGNEAMLDTLELWLADAAVGEMAAQGMVERTTAYIRTGFVKAKLGYNLMTTALQFTGWAQSAAVIGSGNMAVGLAKFIVNPKAAYRNTLEQSQFLTTRYKVGAWDKDVQDARNHVRSMIPTKYRRFVTRFTHSLFVPIAVAQQVVDITTWMGAYHKGIKELELSASDAVTYADTQVEASQTSGFFSDRSGLERGSLSQQKNRQSQFVRIWTTLISYMLAKGNIAYEKTGQVQWKKPSSVMKYAADMALLFTVEGIASALLYSQLPEDDDPEDIAAWVAWRTLESMSAGVPFIREIPGARFSSGNTPIGTFTNDVFDLAVQVGQGEPDEAARKALYNVLGTATHTPSSQLGRTLEAIWFEDDPEWWEYFSGVRDE